MKKILQNYVFYDNGRTKELYGQVVIDDNDREMIENTITTKLGIDLNSTRDETYEGFIEGKTNSFWYEIGYGEWDDPEGFVVSLTEEEAIQELTDKVEEIRKLFNSPGKLLEEIK